MSNIQDERNEQEDSYIDMNAGIVLDNRVKHANHAWNTIPVL